MLTDEELAERIYGMLGSLGKEEETSTAKLLKRIEISPDELLPVGDLNGVHYGLMRRIRDRGQYRAVFGKYCHGCTAMPYHLQYFVENL